VRHGPRATGVTEADDAAETAPATEEQPGRAGWLFGAVTVVPAMLAAAWLLPSFPLLLTGRLSARPMVFMFAPLAAGLCYFALRQLPGDWPVFTRANKANHANHARHANLARHATPSRAEAARAEVSRAEVSPAGAARAEVSRAEASLAGASTAGASTAGASTAGAAHPQATPKARRHPGSRNLSWWPLAATVAIAVAFTAWQMAERTEQLIYLRDPATYLQVAYWIAHHGYLPIPDSVAAFGGPHPGLGFASSNYYPRGTSIVPQFMTGLPLILAAGIWLNGIKAALLITPLIGGCAVLSFGGLAGRLAGPGWAPAAAAVLALSLPQQYTSRGSFSEPLTQVLLFGGLCLLIDSLIVNRGRNRKAGWPNQDKVLAALAGLALGLTIMVRIDALSDILPAVPFLGVLLAARRRQAVPFGLALLVGVGYGLADGYLKSRPYLDLEAPSLRPLAVIVAVTILATIIGVAITANPRARTAARTILTSQLARWLPEAAAVLTIAIFIAFAIRPLIQTVAGETDPTSIAYVAELQKLAGLPIDGHRQYYEDSLYWVIWYLGVPAVLLGASGLALLARNCTRALLTWKDPSAAARVWALPLMMAVWSIVTVLYRPAVAPDQPWASRRLVPFVLPGLILGGIWAATWLRDEAARLDRSRITTATVASCCVASLIIPTALTTLDVSVTSANGVSAHGMAFRQIGGGELTAVDKLCASIGTGASVVILDSLTADRFAQVIRGMCGQPTAILTGPAQAKITTVVHGIESVGRRPVLLAENRAELPRLVPGPGATPKEVVNLLTTQEAHNLTTPPTRTWLIHYTVWMSTLTMPSLGPAA
jgi:hypothetical protein